jgi:hypothetical protein
MSDSDNEIGQ